MTERVRARFSGGVLEPLAPLDLKDGAEVLLSVEGATAGDFKTDECGRIDKPQGLEEMTDAPSSGYLLESQREAAQRLIDMGGSDPGIEDIPRRRSPDPLEARHAAEEDVR